MDDDEEGEVTDPRTVTDPLGLLAALATAMHHGEDGFKQHIAEWSAGYPSAGEGSPGNAANGGPTLAAVVIFIDGCKACEKAGRVCPPAHRTDPAAKALATWKRHVTASLEEAGKAWAVYAAVINPRMGVDATKDPGCDLCAQITDGHCDRCTAYGKAHWCASRYTIDVTEASKRKGQPDTVRRVALCSSCYAFQRPDQAGRLPTHSDVLDHAEGRRRRWKAS